MSLQTYQETKTVQPANGTLFSAFTTAKTVIPAIDLVNLEPNLWYPGRRARVTVAGGLSTLTTTPGTITFQVMMGTIVVFTTGPIQLNATPHVTLPFWVDILLECRSVGSSTSATLVGMGRVQGIMFTLTAAQADAVNTGGIFSAPATLPAVGTGFDSTIANVWDFWAGFSINNAANGIQVQHYIPEMLN